MVINEHNGDGEPDTGELGRRVRVARVWAGLTRDELAARLGVSFHTVERSETGRRRVALDELVRIGELCGVPETFMRHGWAACAQGERLDHLYRRIDELSDEVKRGLGRARAQPSTGASSR